MSTNPVSPMPFPARARSVLTIGAALGLLAVSGCTGNDSMAPDDLGPGTATVTALPTPPQVEAADIAPQDAGQLCDMIGAEIDDWRGQGTVVARIGFNGTVQNWATRTEAINADVLRDTTLIDSVTSGACPQIRAEALEVLGVDTLSDALVGFGG